MGFSAIGFDYDSNHGRTNNDKGEDNNSNTTEGYEDAPYFCPADLLSKLPTVIILPDTERKAAIIEQTAKFVAEKGPQLEILIKTKQATNTNFKFLNYDNKLNPFYRHMTQLIKTAQYFPCKRLVSHLLKSSELSFSDTTGSSVLSNNNSIKDNQLPDLFTLPKIDISSTPYGILVERFKQKQREKRDEQKSKSEQVIEIALGYNCTDNSHKPPQRTTSPSTIEMIEARQKMYEHLYQQYYPHYYHYYKDVYGSVESVDKITKMARDYAASSAANWIQTNMPDPSANLDNDDNDVAIMRKMAEYVALKGEAFEEMMLQHNGDKFAFLHQQHSHYKQYRRLLQREKRKLNPNDADTETSYHNITSQISSNYNNNQQHHSSTKDNKNKVKETSEPIVQIIPSILDSYGSSDDSDNNGDEFLIRNNNTTSIVSFKVNSLPRQILPVTCKRLIVDKKAVVDNSNNNVEGVEDDDYDFTEHLKSSQPKQDTSQVGNPKNRVSRFSLANPKNIIAISALKFDAQMSRKRKAAEMVASKLMKNKTSQSVASSNTEYPSTF